MQYISGWKKPKKKRKPSKAAKLKAQKKRGKKRYDRFLPTLKERAEEHRNNMTEAELYLWEILKTWTGQDRCEAQRILGYRIADFFLPCHNVVIEIDGLYHLRREQRLADRKREWEIKYKGRKLIRFTNDQVMNFRDEVIEAIKEYIAPKKFTYSLLLADWSRKGN